MNTVGRSKGGDWRLLSLALGLVVAAALSLRAGQPLDESSSSVDVDNAITDDVFKWLDQYPNPDGIDPGVVLTNQGDKTASVTAQFAEVKAKTLLDLLNRSELYTATQQYNAKLFFRRYFLAMTLDANVKDGDLPDLLASPAPEAIEIVAHHPEWLDTPQVSAFLGKQLPAIPSNDDETQVPDWVVFFNAQPHAGPLPFSPARTREITILDLAVHCQNPTIRKQLVAFTRRILKKPDVPVIDLAGLLEAFYSCRDLQLLQFSGQVMAELAAADKCPHDRIYDAIRHLEGTNPLILYCDDFDREALQWRRITSRYWAEDSFGLAKLGDAGAFEELVRLTYGPKANSSDLDLMPGENPGYVHIWVRDFPGMVLYHGLKSKSEGVWAGYKQAKYRGGHWFITDADYHGPDPMAEQAARDGMPAGAPVEEAAPPAPEPTPPAPTLTKTTATPSPGPAPVAPKPAPKPLAEKLPRYVTITAAAPIEDLDKGAVVAVHQATLGGVYHVLRRDGDNYILTAPRGKQYEIAIQATAPAPDPKPAVPKKVKVIQVTSMEMLVDGAVSGAQVAYVGQTFDVIKQDGIHYLLRGPGSTQYQILVKATKPAGPTPASHQPAP